MKARLLVGIVVMSSMVVSAISALHAEDVEVKRENGIYYLEVSGTPYECGVQHGKSLKSEIQKSVSDYKANVVKMFGKENGAKILDWR